MRKLHGTGTLVIKSSPEKAWDFIAKPSNWSRLSFMKKVNASIPSGKVAPGKDAYINIVTLGMKNKIRVKFTDFKRPSRMAWRGTVEYSALGELWPRISIEGEMVLKKPAGGVRITIHMNIFPNADPVSNAAFYLMTKALRLERQLDNTIMLLLLAFQSGIEDTPKGKKR